VAQKHGVSRELLLRAIEKLGLGQTSETTSLEPIPSSI
jgi:hypothetical protein